MKLDKKCCACGEVKGASEFHKWAKGSDGLSPRCAVCTRAYRKAARERNIDHHRAKERLRTARRAVKSNEALRAARRARERRRRENDPVYAIHRRISRALSKSLATGKGGLGVFEILGYSGFELKSHLERQFLPGMGWHNIGEWHIDHIVPKSSFDVFAQNDPELRRAWALTNLRPLWAKDNMQKGSKKLTLL